VPTAQVYVNHGNIVADCRCGDARIVEPGQAVMICIAGHATELLWPANLPAVLAALSERLSDKRKNWFPRGHPLALLGNMPHGQTPDELRAETAVGEERDAQVVADRRAELLAQLRELGTDDDIIRDLRRAF
jgi:hypothetical protein